MTALSDDLPSLSDLPLIPYLDEKGLIAEVFNGKIGVYAIFDRQETLQYVGFSRDIGLSLKQHLVRQPHQCYFIKSQTITRPNRTILQEIKTHWLSSANITPEESIWSDSIDAKLTMTEEERDQYQKLDELGQIKFLKNIARRLETEIQTCLKERGVTLEIRFNPKLKEQGLLDLK